MRMTTLNLVAAEEGERERGGWAEEGNPAAAIGCKARETDGVPVGALTLWPRRRF